MSSAIDPRQMTPAEIALIVLSVPDARIESALSEVGDQLMAMEPQSQAQRMERIGYTIPGRNVYAVKYACWAARSRWPGESAWELCTVPDTRQDSVLPPEFVRMIDPAPFLSFAVESGLG